MDRQSSFDLVVACLAGLGWSTASPASAAGCRIVAAVAGGNAAASPSVAALGTASGFAILAGRARPMHAVVATEFLASDCHHTVEPWPALICFASPFAAFATS